MDEIKVVPYIPDEDYDNPAMVVDFYEFTMANCLFLHGFKDTTLVAFVGLMDPLKGVTQIVRADIAWKGIYWEPYIFVGVIFFIICFGMSRYSMYLERKLKTDHR